MGFHLCAVFHAVDQEGHKLYDRQVINRIEHVMYDKLSHLEAAN
jgi:hypothetical protein